MIWYLLYPLRGTTNPPKLPQDHPIRRAFYRHGTVTARHWLLSMLVTCTIGVIFTYPIVFFTDFPTSGMSGLPHHVWTGSSSFEGRSGGDADLEMRQVWIHGSYMKALNKTTLSQALQLQDAILDTVSPGMNAVSPSGSAMFHPKDGGWAFHSPLTYWNNSHPGLESDTDPLLTVNRNVEESSFLNFTLRPLSVFAGKSFANSRLVAADALIISLFNRMNHSMGATWQENIAHLAHQRSESWNMMQDPAQLNSSRVYEYRFQPLSIRQNSALAIAYCCMIIYVAASLRRLKAFRSRFGLVVTAVTQMTTSILASFTVCNLLKINLAQIPQEAYPFVVLTIGLENIFRLINSVLAYPPEMQTTQRIANGLGDIGHSSLASAVQNLFILWLLSLFVSPGVSAFCVFAGVALLFDYFFLITFFVAVLNVDIRRLELQDSIGRSKLPRKNKKTLPDRHTWVDALVWGRVPFTTRMAGSAVTISFVMALNWHFNDLSFPPKTARSWSTMSSKPHPSITDFSDPPRNQTRYPAAWLRMQDYDNARHFMNVVKPGAHAFTAKVFDPIIIVLANADRSGIPLESRTWLIGFRNLAIHHFYPVALLVVFVVAFVTCLMNFLLWDGRREKAEAENNTADAPPLSVNSFNTSHGLDIVKLGGSPSGNIISIGLDRSMSVALFNKALRTYSHVDVPTVGDELAVKWPARGCLLSKDGQWMAALCREGQFLLGSSVSGSFTHELHSSEDESPLVSNLVSRQGASDERLVAAFPDGSVVQASVNGDHRFEQVQSERKSRRAELVAAVLDTSEDGSLTILALDTDGQLVVRDIDAVADSSDWQRKASPLLDGTGALGAALHTAPQIGLTAICTSSELIVLNSSYHTISRLPISNAKPNSVRILHPKRQECPSCGNAAIYSLSFAYKDSETKDATIITLGPPSPATPICLSPSNKTCTDMKSTTRTTHTLEDAGSWSPTSALAIAGLRHRPERDESNAWNGEEPSAALRYRGRNAAIRPLRNRDSDDDDDNDNDDDEDAWEAFIFTTSGEYYSVPALPALAPLPNLATRSTMAPSAGQELHQHQHHHQLYAAEAGPACSLTPTSVAVALGSSVYVVRVAVVDRKDGNMHPGGRSSGLSRQSGLGGESGSQTLPGPGRGRTAARKAM